MRIIVLGAAAGGGFPQWNCNSQASRRARDGDRCARPRTQTGLAVSSDGGSWYLLNASPDLREQIGRTNALHPRDGLRSSPIAGVVLTGGDVDVIAGLLSMRERQAFTVHASAPVHGLLDANPIFEVLARDVVERNVVRLDEPFPLGDDLEATLFAVAGKVPLFMEETDGMQPIVTDGTTVGAMISDGNRRMALIPSCAAITAELAARLDGVDLLFFDSTLWCDDEMVRSGLGAKTGRRMGHMSLYGPHGTIVALTDLGIGRKVAIHINNSNPILLDSSPERVIMESAGWTVPEDGLEFVL